MAGTQGSSQLDRRVVERILQRFPDTGSFPRLKRRARAFIHIRCARSFTLLGDHEHARRHAIEAFRVVPELALEPKGRGLISQITALAVKTVDHPFPRVRSFADSMRHCVRGGFSLWMARHRLLAEMWLAVTLQIGVEKRQRSDAVLAALQALRYNPVATLQMALRGIRRRRMSRAQDARERFLGLEG